MHSSADPTFRYDYATIRDMQATKVTENDRGKKTVEEMTINGEILEPSSRFWISLMVTFGFNNAFWKYFSYDEVFERISTVESSRNRVRLCVESGVYPNDPLIYKTKAGQPYNRLLGVSKPSKPVITYEDLQDKLEIHGSHGQQYANGIVESFHTPRVGSAEFDIAGDLFGNRFVVATPIDGYGLPNVYLMFLRKICSNSMIAQSKIFRSSIKLGKGEEDVSFSFTRMLDQFSNDDGYAAMRQRFEAATRSWASVYECESLYKVISRGLDRAGGLEQSARSLASTPVIKAALDKSYAESESGDELGTPVLRAYHAMTGNIPELYGLANLDAMSMKRQKTMPTKATVYDLLNFATEVATHHSDVVTGRQMQEWGGTLIAGEYDMEDTMTKYPEFKDFFLSAKLGLPQAKKSKKVQAAEQDHANN